MYLFLVLAIIVVSQFQIVILEEYNSGDVESHFNGILNLYNQFRDLDQECADISDQNPGKAFIATHVKPLRSKLKEFGESIKSVGAEFSDGDFQKIKSTQNSLVSEIADLEIKFTDIQAGGEAKKEEIVKRIDALLASMKEVEEKQKELKIEPALDEHLSSTFDPYGHHNLATQIEVQVLKMSMGIVKDLPASLKQLREEAGEEVNEDQIKNMSKEELTQELADRLIQKKNDGMTPSTFLPKMIRTLEDISEFFQAKISENYEFMSEEYVEQSQKIDKYWGILQKRVQDLENNNLNTKDEL